MSSTFRWIVLLLAGALALSACSAMRSLLTGDAASAKPSAPAATAEPSRPRFTFYESWASW